MALAYTVYEVQRTSKPTPARTRELLADIDDGKVRVEQYTICEAKVLQEQEHGGLFYFLRTSDDRVYVAFDYESQRLGVDGEDPLSSFFAPKSMLRIEKTMHSGTTLVEKFEGESLDVPAPIPMTNKTWRWPEPEEFVKVPWTKIEERYGER